MTDILIGNGTPIILANTADHNPTPGLSLLGGETHQFNMSSLGAGAYRQSVKFDMGATRAREWLCRAAFRPISAPTAGRQIEVFIGFSDSATAADSNPGNLSGSDADYNGYGAAATDADECIGQLVRIGHVVVSADSDVMVGEVGIFSPSLRYGMIVVRNGMLVTFIGNGIQSSVHLIPIVDQF
jgi:hypothetical protein